VAHRLHAEGRYVRIVDIQEHSYFQEAISSETLIGNLCDSDFCLRALGGAHIVLHFAATMGGMGTIHPVNNSIIYAENHTMTFNVLAACNEARVKRFLYASSACVYPASLQGDSGPDTDVSLREEDADTMPPQAQELYGLEKLVSELVIRQYASSTDMSCRIARFHNVYVPRGAWRNGREKVPAALVRKVLAARLLSSHKLEIWGNGTQRRSFLFISDCVEAIIRLLELDSPPAEPIVTNIGSDQSVTILDLANLALESSV
jgi:nucleoside-diphosphate-sugar epimerase